MAVTRTLKDFMETIGMKDWTPGEGGWKIDPSTLKIDGPYIDEYAEMICPIIVPDKLYRILIDDIEKKSNKNNP